MTLREFFDITCIDFENYYLTILHVNHRHVWNIFSEKVFKEVLDSLVNESPDVDLGSLKVTKFSIDNESIFICVS